MNVIMCTPISKRKVATIFLNFQELLRKAGELDMFDTLVYNYRLKETVGEEALRDFLKNLNEFMTKVWNLLESDTGMLLSNCQLSKDLESGNIPLSTNIEINCLSPDFNRDNLNLKVSENGKGKLSGAPKNGFSSPRWTVKSHTLNRTAVKHETVPSSCNNNSENLSFYCCRICSKVYKTEKAFSTHACSHRKNSEMVAGFYDRIEARQRVQKFTCGICLEKFQSYDRILTHVAKCEAGPYPCELCSTEQPLLFSTMKSLNCHKRTEHAEDKSFICNECGSSFRANASLRKHKAKVHDNKDIGPFICDSCPKSFPRKILLDNHRQKYHQVRIEKMFRCEPCGTSYMTQASLRVHEEIRHRQTKKFKCATCEKEFLRKDNLQFHQSTHTGVKPFVCEKCGKGFVVKAKLKEHMLRHLGEKKFSCTQAGCAKAYASNSDLKVHLKNHHSQALFVTKRVRKAGRMKKVPTGQDQDVQSSVSIVNTECAEGPVEYVEPAVPLRLGTPIEIQDPFQYPETYSNQLVPMNDQQQQLEFAQPLPSFPGPEQPYIDVNGGGIYGNNTFPYGSQVQNAYTEYSDPLTTTDNNGNGNMYQSYQMQQYNYTSTGMNVNMTMMSETHTVVPAGLQSVSTVRQEFGFGNNLQGVNIQIPQPQHYSAPDPNQNQFQEDPNFNPFAPHQGLPDNEFSQYFPQQAFNPNSQY